MATVTTPAGPNTRGAVAQATSPAVQPGNRRVTLLRSWMLALVSAALAFGLLAGLVAWQANVATYSDYHTIVDDASVSVDAALLARSAALDHMSAAATYLETTDDTQKQAAALAKDRWATFSNESRVSWSNITDQTYGEGNVYAAADSAASDYIQQIGSMFGYYTTGQRDQAGAAFLAARETMNTRLVPALTGLEAVKVEKMEATYAGAAERISNWQKATLVAGTILALIFLVMLLAVRRMHYKWSWPVGLALLGTVLLTGGLQAQLSQASNDARVLVREAYDNVAGVQDLAALLSQERALNSIVVFDPKQASQHLASFEDYGTLVDQRLCGPRNCSANPFLSSDDRVDPNVAASAHAEQDKLGLPHVPLVANVYFPGQANEYETLRQNYAEWLGTHETIKQQVQAGQLQAAAATSTGASAAAFNKLTASTDAATRIARNQFDTIWNRVYALTRIAQALALVFPLGGALAAWGIWRRRNELLG